jgi:hypothetical protein
MTSQKISSFNVSTALTDSDLFTFVVNGTNKNVSFSNFKLGLGVTGTLTATGDPLAVQVLSEPTASDYKIRAIESGNGIAASVSPNNGVKLDWNVSQDATVGSVALTSGLTSTQPVISSLAAGDNVTIVKTGDNIVINSTQLTLTAGANITLVATPGNVLVSGVAAAQEKVSGFIDYNDVTTASTPVSIPATNTFTKLTNDGAGGSTNKLFPPTGVTELWNVATNQFDFTQLELGDQVDIRFDVEVTTTVANQGFEIQLTLGIGGSPYTKTMFQGVRVTPGAKPTVPYFGIYMGDTDTLNNPCEVGVKSASACSVKVIGWYIRVIKYNA